MSQTIAADTRRTVSANAIQRLLSVVNGVDYRRISTPEDFEDVGLLRRKAFNARDVYERKFESPVIEPLDFDPDTYLFGLYHEGNLVSSMRLNMLTAETPPTPAMELFADTLQPLLAQGMTFVDPSRFAIDAEASRLLPALPLLTHRLSTMMTLHMQADYCLCAVKLEHEAYYRRVFGATRLAGPFEPDGMCVKAVLLGISRNNVGYVMSRNPLFYFTETEARLLFDRSEDVLPPLCVHPTAQYAIRAA
ncbi:MAG: hypothetical protein RIB53_13440 [Roseitalea porphyridii]|jgi:hypothetical protein|uniref:N-acyl amino acid synthase FeeM catalytic core domain-containing protein n=1 Tax=Roseitalea porphyridii TaxID=1852022 RepID=A0A4P6V2S5_9HYPH|nr:hypothetical protein [Roseitalea porphyridii]QBK31777.1 hypothetical protein E0E05_14900 [Roseitalea porphyridii]